MGTTSDIHQFACTRYDAVDDHRMTEAFEQLVQDFDQYVQQMRAEFAVDAAIAAGGAADRRDGTSMLARDYVEQLRAKE